MQSNTQLLPVTSVAALPLQQTKRRSGTSGELGVTYEKKILLSCLYRALEKKYEFLLDTNIEGAGAFDDVVFTYKDENGIYQRFYLQAKHKEDERKNRITYNDLLMSANGEYSLYKYFIDYLETIESFKETNNKYFIIYTNIDFQCPKTNNDGLRIHKISDDKYLKFRELDTSNHRPLEIIFTDYNKGKHPAFYHFDQNDESEKLTVIDDLKDKFSKIDKDMEYFKLTKIKDELESKLDGYLNALIFAVDQLNEKFLGNRIKEEIKQNPTLTQVQVDFKFEYALNEIGKWKLRNKANPLTKYDDYFKQAEGKFMKISALYPTLVYENKLTNSNIQLIKEDFIDLSGFICSRKQLWLISSKATWLYSSVIYQALNYKNINGINYANHDNHLFLTWNNLLEGCDLILPTFKEMEESLLIIACQEKDPENDVIVDKIEKIISASESYLKQVIFIAHEKFKASKQLKQKFNTFYDQQCKIEFSDLSPELQEICLTAKKVRFQGKDELSIQDLLESKQFPVPQKSLGKFKLDMSDVEMLLQGHTIEIGSEQPNLGQLESAHFKTQTHIELAELKRALKENPDDIFAFVGEENDIELLLPSDAQQNLIEFADRSLPVENGSFILLKEGQELKQFKQLCYEVDEIKTSGGHGELHLLKKDRAEWVWEQTYCSDFYMERHFYPVVVNIRKLKDALKRAQFDCFVFSETDEETLEQVLGIKIDPSREELNFRNNLAVFQDEKSAQEKCESWVIDVNQNGKSIHWLKLIEVNGRKQIQWHRSWGNIRRLRQLLETEKESEANLVKLSEADLAKSEERVIVLVDEPGMGKTTTLMRISKLIKENKPQSWVMTIDLNIHQSSELTSKQVKTMDDFLNLLKMIDDKLSAPLTRRILRCQLTCPGQVYLLFDGFDEVALEKRQKAILALFGFLKKETASTIWISTRRHDQHKLEDSLSVFAYSFEHLNRNKQTDFLCRFWATTLKLTNRIPVGSFQTVLEKFANTVIQKFEQYIQAHKAGNIFGNPLRIRLLAETYQEVVKNKLIEEKPSSEVFELFKHLNIADLYEQFITKKYDIYLRVKGGMGEKLDEEKKRLMKGYTEDYKLLAVKELFGWQENDAFLRNEKVQYPLNTLARIGLVQKNEEQVKFIHRTFAEYFAAIWFKEHVENLEVKEFLSTWLFKNESGVLRYFFDYFLTQELQLHAAVLKDDMKALQESLHKNSDIDIRDALGRTALHLAAQEGRDEMIQYLQNTKNKNFTRDLLDKTPLHYAGCFGCNKAVDNLLKNYIDVDLKDHIFRTPLHFDVEIGNTIFNKPEYARSKLVALVNERDKINKTPLYYAVSNGCLETACRLVSYGADVDALTIEGKREFLRSAINGLFNFYPAVGLLLIQVPETMARLSGIYGCLNLLPFLFEHGHTKVIDALLRITENKKKINNFKNELKVSGLFSLVPFREIKNSYEYTFSESDYLKVIMYYYEHGRYLGIEVGEEEARDFLYEAANQGFLKPFMHLYENAKGDFGSKKVQHHKSYIAKLFSNVEELSCDNAWFKNLKAESCKHFGWTDLHLAAMNKNVNSIEGLLEPPTYENINRKDTDGITPLIYAAKVSGKSKFIESLFVALKKWKLNNRNQLYEIVNAKCKSDGWTPLHWVIKNSDLDSAKVLLKNIEDIGFEQEQLFNIVNNCDHHDSNPFKYIHSGESLVNAAKLLEVVFIYIKSFNFSSQQCVEILKETGDLLYCLVSACFHKEALILLKGIENLPLDDSHRAEIVSKQFRKENTLLHAAAGFSFSHEIMLLLLKNGAIFNAQNDAQETPLDTFYRCEWFRIEGVRNSKALQKTDFLLRNVKKLFKLVVDEQIISEKLDELKHTLTKLKEKNWIDPESILKARNTDGKTLLDLSKHQEVIHLLQGLRD